MEETLLPLDLPVPPPKGPLVSIGRSCIVCGADDWKRKFKTYGGRRYGPYYDCRPCAHRRHKIWEMANPEWIKAHSVRYYRANREALKGKARRWCEKNLGRLLLNAARIRAKESDLPFDLTIEDIVVPERCPVFGTPLNRAVGRPNHASPTLDRIRPELGYVRGNVQVISRRANNIKSDSTSSSQVRAVADWMESIGL